jgi:hypothetical protein
MAIRIGHASIDENRKAKNGKAGDQTGGEVTIRNYYNSEWTFILRCKDKQKAEIMARACEAGCENKNIGYDQSERNTLRKYAKAAGWDLSKITTPCECDCSSFMTVCAEAAGINVPYSGNNAPATYTMRTAFKSTGMFDVLTPTVAKRRGDIIVKNGHTVMVLDDEEVSIALPVLRKGCKESSVGSLQKLLGIDSDNSFGPKTLAAVKEFQKAHGLEIDGVVGINTWSKLLVG